MVKRVAARGRVHPLLVLTALWLSTAAQVVAQRVATPEEVFGHKIGADYVLPNYTKFMEFFQRLDRDSDRMIVQEIGKTAEGRPQLMAIVTSPQNHRESGRATRTLRRAWPGRRG